MALSNEQLDGINGPGSADRLAAHRAEQARDSGQVAAVKQSRLKEFALRNSGVVPAVEAQRIANEARTGQTAAVEATAADSPADTVPEGSSAFVPGTTIPFGEGGVAINPNATPREPEVRVNPPAKPE